MAHFVFIATSLDDFIADKNGGIDWLHEIPNHTGSDYGYNAFIESIDALVMGRNTFEKVLSFACDWPYTKKVFVLNNTLKEVDASMSGKAEVISGDLKDIVETLKGKGLENLYIDCGKTIQAFLNEGLIGEITINRIPILLGSGISLFGNLDDSFKL
jgi:dihydrofolate reductase